jgi:hypothetical protein
LGLQLVGLCGEEAEVGSLPEDVPGLPEKEPDASRVAELMVGAREFQQRLDGAVGHGGRQPRTQVDGPREVLLGLGGCRRDAAPCGRPRYR